jgi:hypothetical protein
MDDWRVLVGVAVMIAVVVAVGVVQLRVLFMRFTLAALKIEADRDVKIAEAATVNRPQYPALQTLNYGPHSQYQVTGSPERALPADPVLAELAPPALRIPPMRELLANGTIRAGGPLVLGVRAATGDPLLGTQASLFTTADAGKSSSGKTRTAAFIIGQAVLQGTRLLVIDPHMHKADSLSNLLRPLERATVPGPGGRPVPVFVRPIASTQADALAVIATAEQIMEERRTGGPCWSLLLVIDEYTLVIRQGKDLGPRAALVIESVATEGRGFNFNGLIMGQNWKGTRTGGTEVREVLTSAFVHRSVKRQAAYLIQDDALAARAETLTKGWAIFAPTDDDPELIGIPLAEAADLATIAQLLAVLATAPATGTAPVYADAGDAVSPVSPPFPPASGPVSGEILQKRPGPPSEMDPTRVEAVREAVQAGMAQGQILEQVWAVKAGGGAAYKAATDEFRAILAYLVGR